MCARMAAKCGERIFPEFQEAGGLVLEKCEGRTQITVDPRLILGLLRTSSHSLFGTSASSARSTKSFLCRAYERRSRVQLSVAILREFGLGCCLEVIGNGG